MAKRSRRWLDGDILLKVGGGGLALGAALFCWFGLGFSTRGLFVVGALGLACLVWGLMSIGDYADDGGWN